MFPPHSLKLKDITIYPVSVLGIYQHQTPNLQVFLQFHCNVVSQILCVEYSSV